MQVFRDERSAPVAASLEEILGCRSLLSALQMCMRAKQNRPPQLAQPAVQLLGDAPNCTSLTFGVMCELSCSPGLLYIANVSTFA